MKKFKKAMALGLVFAMCATVVAGCGNDNKQQPQADGADKQQQPAADEIYIGGLSPLTGDLAVYGTANTKGAEMAFKEINAAGGINGAQIKIATTPASNNFV